MDAEEQLDEALALARALARLACTPGNLPPYSIGTKVALLDELELRVRERREEEA